MIELTHMKQQLSHLAQLLVEEDVSNVPQAELSSSTITEVVQVVLAIFAAVAVLIIAISAFRIIISRGSSEDVGRARDAIIYASIGLIISMAAFAIVAFVIRRV